MTTTATRACTKRSFASKQEANTKLDSIDAERPRRPGRKLPVRSYWCQHCSSYHITSKALREHAA